MAGYNVAGGRNGYGAKLCNIFSKKFTVETSSRENDRCFKQTWTDNMGKTTDAIIKPSKGEDYTCVTFEVCSLSFLRCWAKAFKTFLIKYNSEIIKH